MRVLVTGSTGFVGTHLVDHLIADGHTVVAYSRSATPSREGVIPIKGDITDRAALEAAMTGCDAVIHLVGIIREFPARGITFQELHVEATQGVLEAAKAAGIRRYLHMSALGARADSPSGYHTSKAAAEALVRASGLDWTIFCPSVIYGPGSEFIATMLPLAKLPFFPVIGGGQTSAQPVHVGDVARGFVRALTASASIGQSYEVGGPESLTYKEIYSQIAVASGHGFRPLTIPLWAVAPLATLLQYQPWFPLTPTQLTMLREDNVGDASPWERDFGIAPIRLTEGLSYLSGGRERGL